MDVVDVETGAAGTVVAVVTSVAFWVVVEVALFLVSFFTVVVVVGAAAAAGIVAVELVVIAAAADKSGCWSSWRPAKPIPRPVTATMVERVRNLFMVELSTLDTRGGLIRFDEPSVMDRPGPVPGMAGRAGRQDEAGHHEDDERDVRGYLGYGHDPSCGLWLRPRGVSRTSGPLVVSIGRSRAVGDPQGVRFAPFHVE